MNDPIIELPDHRIELGSTLQGRVRWTSDREGKLEAMTVTATWHTEGRGEKNEFTAATFEIRGKAQLQAGLDFVHAFSLKMPATAPLTYDGKLIRVKWTVNVQLHLPWATDRYGECRLLVVPKGARKATWAIPTAG